MPFVEHPQESLPIAVGLVQGKRVLGFGHKIRNRHLGIRLQNHPFVDRGQKTRTETRLLVVRQPTGIGKHDEGRKIVGQVSKCIGDPSSHAGKTREEKSGVHHVSPRAMDIGLGGHRHEKGHLIDELGLLGKKLTDPTSRLAMLRELVRTLHQGTSRCGETLRLLLGAEHLAMQPFEFRFVVVQIHGTCSTGHEQLHDPLDLGDMVLDSTRTLRRVAWVTMSLPLEHGCQCQGGKAATGLQEHRAAIR